MLLTSDTELRQYIPNALVTVQGEQSLFEKLHIELALSEQWLTTRILGETLHKQLSNASQEDSAAESSLFEEVGEIVKRIIASDAFLRAIPSLDLVLTPNGFGVVSNTTIAPASKDRVERLQQSLLQSRDFAIDTLLHSLCQDTTWRTTPQGRYFLATLFPTLSSLNASRLSTLNGTKNSTLNPHPSWDYFEQVHSSLTLIEQELADKFISQALYSRLRNYIPTTQSTQTTETTQTTSEAIATLLPLLQAIELELLQGKPLPYQQLIQLVDFIRTRPDTFPEWQSSPTATLFQPHAFENKKTSAGYWF